MTNIIHEVNVLMYLILLGLATAFLSIFSIIFTFCVLCEVYKKEEMIFKEKIYAVFKIHIANLSYNASNIILFESSNAKFLIITEIDRNNK